MMQSGRQDWETPQWLFDQLNAEFHFIMDVCASAENAKCPAYFDEADDALQWPWIGSCWMNPPYGKGLDRWIRKAYESSREGATVVCLVPAKTDTRWWHQYVEGKAEVRFIRGRLTFVEASAPAPFPSVVLIFS